MEKINPDLYERSYFEEHYQGYPDYGFYPLKARKILQLAADLGVKPKTILDAAGAYGYITRELRAVGVEAVTMDISRYAGQKSRLICEGWFVRGSLTHLPFKDKAFQCLFCEGALEHVPEELIPQVFKEFQRVSEIRILAISFNAPTDKHHLCNHSVDWWFQRIPPNTWLFGAEGTQTKGWWFIKTIGNNGEENVFARIL